MADVTIIVGNSPNNNLSSPSALIFLGDEVELTMVASNIDVYGNDTFFARFYELTRIRITAEFKQEETNRYRLTACIGNEKNRYKITATILQSTSKKHRITANLIGNKDIELLKDTKQYRLTAEFTTITTERYRITAYIDMTFYTIELHGMVLINQNEDKTEDRTPTNIGVIGGESIVL